MYGTDPFSAQDATRDPSHTPSIFGALPYPATPFLPALVTFRFTSLSPTVLDSKVVGPNSETCYCVVTGGGGHTVLKDARGNHMALVAWVTHATVEARCVGGTHLVGQWLQLASSRRARMMVHGGVQYSWAPIDRFLHLFASGSSEWLVRVTKSTDAVLLELTPRAIELGLLDIAILATILLQSGKNID